MQRMSLYLYNSTTLCSVQTSIYAKLLDFLLLLNPSTKRRIAEENDHSIEIGLVNGRGNGSTPRLDAIITSSFDEIRFASLSKTKYAAHVAMTYFAHTAFELLVHRR